MSCGIIVTCQGSDWTKEVYPKMMQYGWQGIFIDASSALRTDPESVIVLDPINRE
jgi:aspartate-semialdehyde dehydrogenase